MSKFYMYFQSSDDISQQVVIEEINEKELELYALKSKLSLQTDNDPRKVDILLKNALVCIKKYVTII